MGADTNVARALGCRGTTGHWDHPGQRDGRCGLGLGSGHLEEPPSPFGGAGGGGKFRHLGWPVGGRRHCPSTCPGAEVSIPWHLGNSYHMATDHSLALSSPHCARMRQGMRPQKPCPEYITHGYSPNPKAPAFPPYRECLASPVTLPSPLRCLPSPVTPASNPCPAPSTRLLPSGCLPLPSPNPSNRQSRRLTWHHQNTAHAPTQPSPSTFCSCGIAGAVPTILSPQSCGSQATRSPGSTAWVRLYAPSLSSPQLSQKAYP
jgi:hypothetical protein